MAEENQIFDIDEQGASGFEPVTVRFRGTEYQLGTTAYGLVATPALLAVGEDTTEHQVLAHIMKNLRACIRLLCADLHDAIEADANITPGEEFALMKAVMEVLNRIGRFSDDTEEDERRLQPSDDSEIS